MQQRLEARAFKRVASILQPGEQPVVAARAMVGSFSASRFGTAAQHGVVLTLAEATIGFVSQLRLAFAQGDGLSLTFPRSDKKNAVSLAEALQQA